MNSGGGCEAAVASRIRIGWDNSENAKFTSLLNFSNDQWNCIQKLHEISNALR